MNLGHSRLPVLAAVLAAGLAGCTASGSDESGGSAFGNLFKYGGTTVPPVAANIPDEVLDCPPVTVTDGGAAVRVGGEGAGVRSQIAIANVARECNGRAGGAIAVKVGVQGRALLGQGGGASAHFDTPLTIALKRGDQVLVTRTRRVSVTIPAGSADASWVVVEDELVVPAGTGEFDIEVGLGNGGGGTAEPARRRRKRA